MEVTLTEFNFINFNSFSILCVLWTRNVKSLPLIVHSNTNYLCVNIIFNFFLELFLTKTNKIIQYRLLMSLQNQNVRLIMVLPIPQLIIYSAAFSVNVGLLVWSNKFQIVMDITYKLHFFNCLPSFQDLLQKRRILFYRCQCLAIFAPFTKCN
jgi:hypothetical protein